MCNINDPRILDTYIAITEYEPTDWLLLGYHDSRDVISLYSFGNQGLSEFRDHITNEILFGFIRIEEKFVLVTYIPDSVSGVRRARALVHSRAVAGVLELSHLQITASSLNDLSEISIRTRLKLEQLPARTKSRSSSFISQAPRRRKSVLSTSSFLDDDFDDDTCSDRTNVTTPTLSVDHDFNLAQSDTDDRLQDQADDLLQSQLQKKKELEESRFKLFQPKPNFLKKRIEEEQKRLKQQQQKEKEMPKWQLELQQRKLKKKEQDLRKIQSFQQLPVVEEVRVIPRPKSVQSDYPLLTKQKSIHDIPVMPRVESPIQKMDFLKPLERTHSTSPLEIKQSTLELKKSVPDLKKTIKIENAQPKVSPLIYLSGFVSVQLNESPFWRRRYYVLNEENMLFYKDELTNTSLYQIQFRNVKRVSLIDEDEEAFVPNSFMIETNQNELYQILADDKNEFKKLYTTLKQYV